MLKNIKKIINSRGISLNNPLHWFVLALFVIRFICRNGLKSYCVLCNTINKESELTTTMESTDSIPETQMKYLTDNKSEVSVQVTENKIFTHIIDKDHMNSIGRERNELLCSTVRNSMLELLAFEINNKNIKGNVAELGVHLGDFAMLMNICFPGRKLYLFDTFEGFNGNDIKKDLELGGGELVLNRANDYSNTNENIVLRRMKYPDNCIIKKGYFPETASELDEEFVFVSLDADLYQPMLEGLKYFYPRLSKGGYVFVHDFFNDVFSGTKKAVIEYSKTENIQYVPLGDKGSIAIVKK
jgi:O-methyltransferase